MLYDGDVKWIPVRTAAQMLGISRVRVYQLIERGELTSIQLDGTVLASRRSVELRQVERERREKDVG